MTRGTGQAVGKVLHEVADLVVDRLEGHRQGLVVDGRAVPGKEGIAHDPVELGAKDVVHRLQERMVEDDHGHILGGEVADFELLNLGLAPDREKERAGSVGFDGSGLETRAVGHQGDWRAEVEDQLERSLAVDLGPDHHVVGREHLERNRRLLGRGVRRRGVVEAGSGQEQGRNQGEGREAPEGRCSHRGQNPSPAVRVKSSVSPPRRTVSATGFPGWTAAKASRAFFQGLDVMIQQSKQNVAALQSGL